MLPSIIVLISGLNSCSPSKYLAEDEFLYANSKIDVDKRKTDVASLKKYEKISTNQKVLGLRLHLFLYNLSNPKKESFPSSWFKKIGEPPVVFDSLLVNKTNDNFEKYLADRGFNSVQVESSVKKRFKKARVKYKIDLGDPTIINSIKYSFEDTSISKYVFADTALSLIKIGTPFDKVLFQKERERIERNLKNQGFYKFSREYIYYEVSKTQDPLKVDVNIITKQNLKGSFDPVSKVRKHKKYRINDVYIYPNHSDYSGIRRKDTVDYQQHKVVYYTKPIIKPSTLVRANDLLPGSLYSLKDVDRTYTDFGALGLFRYVNIDFEELPEMNEFGQLDCKIDLAMRKRQSYSFEFVATNSSYDLGVRSGIIYNNYNIFKGGEHLQIGLTGAVESLQNRLGIAPMSEIGISSKLESPKFFLPFFKVEEFQKRIKPRTEVVLSYNYQNQPNYSRTIANASFGYNWSGNSNNRHVFHPIDFYLVKLSRVDTAYIDSTYGNTRLENSFINHTILGMKYGFEFNNQQLHRGISFVYFKYNIESAGLLVNSINRMSDWGRDSLLFEVQYFQYVKTDVDFRNYIILTPRNKLVYRLFAGVGVPYGNSESMPFEKMYWSGGPYGIRAWGERTLGPGPNYSATDYNQLGDVKLEASIEYRFKVIWKLESALFVDAGNIWLLNEASELPGSGFKWDTFYKDIAVGVGMGARFDFSFVLLRTDFGFKLRDPSLEGNKITFKNPDAKFWDFTFQFGIGYPF